MKDQIYPPGSPEPHPTARTGVDDLVRLSSSFDGFKRENAVRRLGMIGDPAAIPALIVRANDWVPEVRAAACDALIKMLTPANAAAFVASLPQLLHLPSSSCPLKRPLAIWKPLCPIRPQRRLKTPRDGSENLA